MRRFAIIPGIIFLLGTILTGCGGGSKPTNNAVTTVVVTPTSLSLNDGDVVQLTATAQNSSGTAVSATFTYSSSNPSLVTVSSSGLVCGGVWDTSFIVCNGKNGAGTPVSGTATITVTASGVSSSPVTASVHPKVSSIVVDPVAACTSSTLTQQFTGHACSALVIPHDSSGPCAPNASEVTSQIGALTWGTVDPTVATIDSTGLVTAVNPGLTGVFANVSGVNSATVPFRTCMPIEIRLHVNGDPPGTLTTSATMTQNQTLTLETDMTDEKGVVKNSLATISASNFPLVGSFSGTTLTAASFGGAGLFSACTPPTCGSGLNTPVYSNLFSVTVSGTSPAPIVWATSSFTPPSGTSATLVPIDTSKNPPVAGTAINLPGTPNSLVFAANGSNAYLGTTGGLVSSNPSTNTVTTLDPNITGKVLAVSNNGTKIIVSNAAKDPQGNVIQPVGPSQRLWVVDTSSSTEQTFVKPGAVAASISNDGFRDYIVTNDGTGNIYVFSPALSLQTINIPGNSTSVAGLPSGPYAYIANSAGLEVVATCNNVQQPTANNPPTHSSTIQLVQPVANADQIVAVDSSGIDVETVTVKSILSTNPPLPFVLSPATCAPPVSYSNQFLDFGIGAFTATQLLVATNGARVAVLPVGNPHVLSAAPGATPAVAAIPLAGAGTEALSGGMTPDGNTVWVGVAGTNTVDEINLNSGTDAVQVTTSFKKSDGSAAPPDIVAVQPK